jgi:DUF4097 and DUF4098 domain-containing protein YvlB
MRPRSLAAPILLIALGGIFLANNLRPDLPLSELLGLYWPFLLIAWGLIRLVEVIVSYFRGRMQGSTFSGGEIFLIVLICVLGSGLFAAHRHGFRLGMQGLEMFGDHYDFDVSEHKPTANVRRIVVQTLRGKLRVHGADAQEFKISGRKTLRALTRAEADQAHQSTPLEIVVEGDRAVVRTNQDRLRHHQRITEDLEMTIPRGVSLEIAGNSGDYEIVDISGDVEIWAERADIRLTNLAGSARLEVRRSEVIRAVDVRGSLSLEGSGSDIELENIAGQVTVNGSYGGTLNFKKLAKPLRLDSRNTELRVAGLPGRISMDLGDFDAHNVLGPMRLMTKSRDVRIENFTESLELETERGDIELEPGRVPLAKIEARSRSGKIELVLPPQASFQLHATTERGEAINEFGPAIHSETEGHSTSLKGGTGSGPLIRINTHRGTVAIRKAGAPATESAPTTL